MSDNYTIQLDKASTFECNVKIEGVSLNKTKANLIVESDDFSLKFKGDIDSTGKITVPLKKLKGILDENITGNLYLEIIADDTYFTPYETEYITEVSKKVEVVSVNNKTKGQSTLTESKNKPVVTVANVKGSKSNLVLEHAKTLTHTILSEKINISNPHNKDKILGIITSYLGKHNLNENINKNIISTLFRIIAKIKK
jgi:hypothetical protein